MYLTTYKPSEPKEIKETKQYLLRNWGNIKTLKINHPVLSKIVTTYQQTNDWLQTYQQISYKIRELHIAAYQSYLWNECIKKVLYQIMAKELISIPYKAGSLLFYRRINTKEREALPKSFKTIASEMELTPSEEEIISRVLVKEKVEKKDFKLPQELNNYFLSRSRKTMIIPKDLKVTPLRKDELNKNSFKITISFTLPKGSYATILIKRICGH